MKKIFKGNRALKIILLFLTLFSFKGYSQVQSDQALIIQKCIDLPSVKEYFTINPDGTYKELHILNFPFSFDQDISTMKFSQPIIFNSRLEIQNINPDLFWAYRKFLITGTTASVIFEISYNRLSKTSGFLFVNVELTKSNGNWNILNSTINYKSL